MGGPEHEADVDAAVAFDAGLFWKQFRRVHGSEIPPCGSCFRVPCKLRAGVESLLVQGRRHLLGSS